MSSGSKLTRLLLVAIAVTVAAGVLGVLKSGRAAARPHRLVIPYVEPHPSPSDPTVLRVCADPNNLPFSNAKREGFENVIADRVAASLGRRVEYYWQPQRRGFIRTTLNAGWCDVVIGVPAGFELALTTRPYYRSTYVFVSRRHPGSPVHSLDDPALRRLRIGVEMTGEDYDNPPALQALATRNLVSNIRGYLVYGDYSTPDPPQQIVNAVSRGDIDTAIVWGPRAGYFARRATEPLDLVTVTPEHDALGLQFGFDVAMAVRKSDQALHDALDATLAQHGGELRQILSDFGVPLVQKGSGT